jgi:hypothetical protein
VTAFNGNGDGNGDANEVVGAIDELFCATGFLDARLEARNDRGVSVWFAEDKPFILRGETLVALYSRGERFTAIDADAFTSEDRLFGDRRTARRDRPLAITSDAMSLTYRTSL